MSLFTANTKAPAVKDTSWQLTRHDGRSNIQFCVLLPESMTTFRSSYLFKSYTE